MYNNNGLKDTLRNMRKQGTEPMMETQSIENLMANTFRMRPNRICIPLLKDSHPAFRFWLEKLKPNEKLPRGNYFRRYAFLKNKINAGHCVSVADARTGMQIDNS